MINIYCLKRVGIILILLFTLSICIFGQVVKLYTAAVKGDVKVEGTAVGGYSKFHLKIKNKTGTTQRLLLVGTYFAPQHNSPRSSSQREAVVKSASTREMGYFRKKDDMIKSLHSTFEYNFYSKNTLQYSYERAKAANAIIEIPAYGSWVGEVASFCIDPSRPSPRSNERYRLVPAEVPKPILEVVLEWVNNPEIPQGQIQKKVWDTIRKLNLKFYDPNVKDIQKLRKWMQGSRVERDGAEIILKAGKFGYWSLDLLTVWIKRVQSERKRAKRVTNSWSEYAWLSNTEVETIRKWMKRSMLFKELAEMALKVAISSKWPNDMLNIWVEKSSSEKDRAERIFIEWGQDVGRRATNAEINQLTIWIEGITSDKDRAERVLEGSHPGYWPPSIMKKWEKRLVDRPRVRRILKLWGKESKRKSAYQEAQEREI